MSTDRDVTRIVRSWLNEDRHEDAHRVLNTVLAEIETTPRRRSFWSAWRFPIMNNALRVGLAAAAVMIIAVIAIQFLPGSNTGGPGPVDTPQPTFSPASSASSVPPLPDGLLEPGTYSVRPQDIDAPRVVLTVPAGWHGGGFGVSKGGSIDLPDGAGIILWGGEFNVYGDPCQWVDTLPSPGTGPTVDDLVAGLSAQALRSATAPTDIMVDGFVGKAIELTVPDDIAFDPADGFVDCDQSEFRSWISSDGGSFRLHQGPGQHDQLWIVDAGGKGATARAVCCTRVIIDATFYSGTSSADMAEIQAILDSIHFE